MVLSFLRIVGAVVIQTNRKQSIKFLPCVSLATGKVQECGGVANLVPLFNKGCRDNPRNLEQQASLTVVVKILERMFRDRIYCTFGRAWAISSLSTCRSPWQVMLVFIVANYPTIPSIL